jgi:hypothetical protein
MLLLNLLQESRLCNANHHTISEIPMNYGVPCLRKLSIPHQFVQLAANLYNRVLILETRFQLH